MSVVDLFRLKGLILPFLVVVVFKSVEDLFSLREIFSCDYIFVG